MVSSVVDIQQEHVYRKGRLILPTDLVDRGPKAQAQWLSGVPVADRARAFRALPTNVGVAAFLLMEPQARIGLLAGLGRQSIKHLVSLANDAFLLETLRYAGEDVYTAVLSGVPDWRQQRIVETQRREAAEHQEAEQSRKAAQPHRAPGLARLFRWFTTPG